jgi:uracil-DNA glycosylase
MRAKKYWVDQLGERWTEALKPLLKSDYMENLMDRLQIDYALKDMLPEKQENIFKAFRLCPLDKLRIVVIGTEPSSKTGTNGLAFGDNFSLYNNPSAQHIQRSVGEYTHSLGFDFDYTFEKWAHQGILLLNRTLTSDINNPKIYRDSWKKFFGSVIYILEKYKPGTIFLLWGTEAGKYSELLSLNHHVFSWEHPMKADKEYREWKCPNFAQVDVLLNSLYGESGKINW